MTDVLENDETLVDVGDPKQVRESQRKAKRKQKDRDAALSALMEHSQTRGLLWDLLVKCQVFSTSFSHSAIEMAYKEGKRSIGLELLAEINRVAPEMYAVMAKEANETK